MDIQPSTGSPENGEKRVRSEFQSTPYNARKWYGSKEQQNQTNAFFICVM